MAETKIVAARVSDSVEFQFSELALGDGSASLPSLAFGSDQDTGLYRDDVNSLSFTTGGTRRWTIDAVGSLSSYNSSIIRNADGTAGSPSFSFGNDPTTGIYRPGVSTIGFSAGGTAWWYLNADGNLEARSTTAKIQNRDGSAASPSYSFAADQDSGIYRISSDVFALAVAATTKVRISTQGLGLDTDGSNAAPGLYWSSDPSTGFYRSSGGNTRYTAAGVNVVSFINSGLEISNSTAVIQNQAGSAAAPSYTFVGDTDTGIYHAASNTFLVSCGAVTVFEANASNVYSDVTHRFIDGTAATPSLTFGANPDTGIYRPGSNQVGISGGGATIATFDSASGGNALTLNQSFVGRFSALNVNNTANNTAADVIIGLGVNDGNAGDPFIVFAIGGPTRYWTMGVDNDQTDTFFISTTPNGTAKPGTGNVFGISAAGTAATLGPIVPFTDNSASCGIVSQRWTAVFAVNGTIQTSMSSTKENVEEMPPEECSVPMPVYFNRPGDTETRIGWLADDLPEEAHPVIDKETGERSTTDVYTDAILAMLARAARNDYEEIQALKAEIALLKTEVETLKGA